MSKFFINRPIVAMVISILMVIVGVVAMLSLPISQFPNIVPPEVLVQATYPGADAKTLEQSVATPIEQQVSGVDHMNYMYSTNANNGQMRSDGRLRYRHQSEYRSGPHAASRQPGHAAAARAGEHLGRDGDQVALLAADVRHALLAARAPTTRIFSSTTPTSTWRTS